VRKGKLDVLAFSFARPGTHAQVVALMPRPIRWVGYKELLALPSPDGSMYTRRRAGIYDVGWGVDGWVVLAPGGTRWSYDGREWIEGTSSRPPRGVPGAVTLDEARLFAERVIARDEGRLGAVQWTTKRDN
jgi:hypothetical protein